jgi:hypothetical protein
MDEYDVRNENAAGMLIRNISVFSKYYDDERAEIEKILSPWSRSTFLWSLECEDIMTSQEVYELIY